MYGQPSDTPLQDFLTFDAGQVSSQALARDEFGPARFTISLTEGASPVWEAMQSSQRVGVVFWRGEWQDDRMHGIISQQPLEGESHDYLFTGRRMASTAPDPVPAAESDAAPSTPVP